MSFEASHTLLKGIFLLPVLQDILIHLRKVKTLIFLKFRHNRLSAIFQFRKNTTIKRIIRITLRFLHGGLNDENTKKIVYKVDMVYKVYKVSFEEKQGDQGEAWSFAGKFLMPQKPCSALIRLHA